MRLTVILTEPINHVKSKKNNRLETQNAEKIISTYVFIIFI